MRLAAEWAGFRTIAHSEINPFCCELLGQKFPGEPNLGDIRNHDAWPDLGHVSIITGGPPCQPFSIAGRKLGTADDRDLWPSMLGVIRRVRPDWAVVENVVNAADMVLASWQDDLESAGYSSQAFDLPSCAVGLPSVERHIWLVAAANGARLPRHVEGCIQGIGLGEGRKAWPAVEWWAPEDEDPRVPRGWPAHRPKLLRTRKGTANYVDRIKAIGNAVPPPVAYQILKAIRELIVPNNP